YLGLAHVRLVVLVAQVVPFQAAVAQLLHGLILELPLAALGEPAQPQRHLALAAQLLMQFAAERSGAAAAEVHAVAAHRAREGLVQRRTVVEKDAVQRFARAIQRLQVLQRHAEHGLGHGACVVRVALAPHLAVAGEEEGAVDEDGGTLHRKSSWVWQSRMLADPYWPVATILGDARRVNFPARPHAASSAAAGSNHPPRPAATRGRSAGRDAPASAAGRPANTTPAPAGSGCPAPPAGRRRSAISRSPCDPAPRRGLPAPHAAPRRCCRSSPPGARARSRRSAGTSRAIGRPDSGRPTAASR